MYITPVRVKAQCRVESNTQVKDTGTMSETNGDILFTDPQIANNCNKITTSFASLVLDIRNALQKMTIPKYSFSSKIFVTLSLFHTKMFSPWKEVSQDCVNIHLLFPELSCSYLHSR